jgi:hypothetical protein
MKALVAAAWLLTQGVGFQQGTSVVAGRILSPDGKPAVGVRVAAVPAMETGRGREKTGRRKGDHNGESFMAAFW